MNTKSMFNLKEMLCTDLDQYARKGSLTKNDLEAVNMIMDTIKNIDKISAMDEQGYSYGDGNWNAYGSYSNGMMDGRNSGRRSGYNNGNSDRRYSGNNYSNDSSDMESRMRREMNY